MYVYIFTKSVAFSTELYPSVLQKNIEYSCKAHRQPHGRTYTHREFIQSNRNFSIIWIVKREIVLKLFCLLLYSCCVCYVEECLFVNPCVCVYACDEIFSEFSCLPIEFSHCFLFQMGFILNSWNKHTKLPKTKYL